MFKRGDFLDLCKIDLDQVSIFNFFYDNLRALSHGEYKNAYFINDMTRKKIHIKIEIEVE